MKSRIRETFKKQWRRPRPRITYYQLHAARRTYEMVESSIRQRENHDLAETFFLYGWVAGYDEANRKHKEKKR